MKQLKFMVVLYVCMYIYIFEWITNIKYNMYSTQMEYKYIRISHIGSPELLMTSSLYHAIVSLIFSICLRLHAHVESASESNNTWRNNYSDF